MNSILLIDSETVVATALQAALGQFGFEVELADSGKAAHAWLEESISTSSWSSSTCHLTQTARLSLNPQNLLPDAGAVPVSYVRKELQAFSHALRSCQPFVRIGHLMRSAGLFLLFRGQLARDVFIPRRGE
jgi:hypothetical protein